MGIPTMADRAMQALYLLGLDPIMETLADGHSYGFRLERCCADALDECHKVLRGPHGPDTHGPDWVLEGDIKSCFDRISHDWLLANVCGHRPDRLKGVAVVPLQDVNRSMRDS